MQLFNQLEEEKDFKMLCYPLYLPMLILLLVFCSSLCGSMLLSWSFLSIWNIMFLVCDESFSVGTFKSLSLTFSHLIMTYLDESFEFILFGVYSAAWMYRLMIFINFEKSSQLFKHFFCPFLSSFSFCDSHYAYICVPTCVLQFSDVLLYFSFLFFSLDMDLF